MYISPLAGAIRRGFPLDLNGRIKCVLERIDQILDVLQTSRDPYALLEGIVPSKLLLFFGFLAKHHHVIRQHDGDVAAQVRAGVESATVVKGSGSCYALKLDVQETAVAGVGQFDRAASQEAVVVGFVGQQAGILDSDNGGVVAANCVMQKSRHGLCVAVKAACTLEEVVRVGEKHLRVAGKELVVVSLCKSGRQLAVVGRQRVEDDGAAEDVGPAVEALGEGSEDNVRVCQHVDVCEASNGVVHNQHEAVLFGQLLEARQVCAFQGRVAWELDNDEAHFSALLGFSFEPSFHIVKALLVDFAEMLESVGALLEQMVLGIVEDDAEDDVGSRAVLLDEIRGMVDASHAAGVEIDVVGFALHQLWVNRGAVDELVDAFTEQLVSWASGRESWLGSVPVIVKWDFDQCVNVAQQMLSNTDGESEAGIAPAKHEGFGVLGFKDDGVDTMAGHVDAFEGEV